MIYISRITEIFRGSKRGVQKGGPKDPFGGVQMRGSMFYLHPTDTATETLKKNILTQSEVCKNTPTKTKH